MRGAPGRAARPRPHKSRRQSMEQTLPALIAVRAHVGIRSLHGELVRLLKERHGTSVHVFCAVPEDVRAFDGLGRDGLFDRAAGRREGLVTRGRLRVSRLRGNPRGSPRKHCRRAAWTRTGPGVRRRPPAVGRGPHGCRSACDARRSGARDLGGGVASCVGHRPSPRRALIGSVHASILGGSIYEGKHPPTPEELGGSIRQG